MAAAAQPPTITKVLVANRGEISCRLQAACHKLGLDAVAVFTAPDALSRHVLTARESVCLGDAPREYLNADKLLRVALDTGEGSSVLAGGLSLLTPVPQAGSSCARVCALELSWHCVHRMCPVAHPHCALARCARCRLPGGGARLRLPLREHRLCRGLRAARPGVPGPHRG